MIWLKRFFINFIDRLIPSDFFARRYPISVKGIVEHKGKFFLLKTNRNHWDLPGGKIKSTESPRQGLKREVYEELNLEVEVGEIIDSYFLNIRGRINVFIVIYKCALLSDVTNLQISFEHEEVGLFSLDDLEQVVVNNNYKKNIKESILPSNT